jgi:hypothetical protein
MNLGGKLTQKCGWELSMFYMPRSPKQYRLFNFIIEWDGMKSFGYSPRAQILFELFNVTVFQLEFFRIWHNSNRELADGTDAG